MGIYILVKALAFLLLISVYIIVNLNSKVSKIEIELARATEIETNSLNMYHAMLALCITAARDLAEVDRRGAFEADDEVGFSFKTIKIVIDNLVAKIKEFEKADDDETNNTPTTKNQQTNKDKKKENR